MFNMYAEYLIIIMNASLSVLYHYIAATGGIREITSNSGVPLSFMLTFEPAMRQKTLSLDISDDNIALENPEVIVLSLSSKCNIITSIGQMQVTILDNDGMMQASSISIVHILHCIFHTFGYSCNLQKWSLR